MTDSQTPMTDGESFHRYASGGPGSEVCLAEFARSLELELARLKLDLNRANHELNCRALDLSLAAANADKADLIAALETVSNDAEDVYQALARGETPIISIGRWRRLTEARATLAGVPVMSASDTPRTDREIARLVVPTGDTDAALGFWNDMTEHAKRLERESAAKDATIARLREALCRVVTHAECDHDGMTYQELADMAAAALVHK